MEMSIILHGFFVTCTTKLYFSFRKAKKDRNPYYLKDSGTPAKESMRQDLNLRPLRPERSALPS